MPKKLTIEYIRSKFVEENYKLLTNEYINSKQKLEYECPNGHRHSVTWSNWNGRKIRCSYCNGITPKHTTKEIREAMAKEGYILLTKKYGNNKQHLDFICPNGHKHKIRWDGWVLGRRCFYCSDNVPPTIEEIKMDFEAENYKLLTEYYVNSTQRLSLACSNGHKADITWNNWWQGCRCRYCAGNVKHTIEFVRNKFEEENYELITDFYVNQKQKLDYICPMGHKHSITWTDWYNGGYRCPTCYAIKISGEGNYNWKGGISKEPYSKIWNNMLKKDIKKRDGYRCLNPYCYSNNPTDVVVHHINYNKKDCAKNNLITICRACNIRAEINREWHKAWYQAIMHRRYKYNY